MAISIDPAGRKLRLVRGTNIAVAAPWTMSPAELRKVGKGILGHPQVKAALGKNRSRLLSLEPLVDPDQGPPLKKPTRFRAVIYDYVKNRALVVQASQGRSLAVKVSSRRAQPLPSSEEWDDAVAILRADPELGELLGSEQIGTYPAMPPLSERESALGEIERALHVGLRPLGGSGFRNTIVAVNLIRRTVERYNRGAPPSALATEALCGAPDPVSFSSPPRGTPGSLWISWPAANPVWKILVTRPSASSGTRGSGIDIKFADYNNQRVLTQGHVPILNVLYDGNACGPYRDWQWQEHNFLANGSDVAPGFRWCTSRPQTIIDSGSDAGNFNGVAIFEDTAKRSLLMVSEMTAGWYRYITEWTFTEAGWILPRFKFAATASSCVCRTHNHHCYWRLNFDINDAQNDIMEEWAGTAGWQPLTNEVKRYRDASAGRKWRVRDATAPELLSYQIVPGHDDGTALGDDYARGDAWFLRYNNDELDDHYNNTGGSGTPANLDIFVTGESLVREDVVFWYGGHFRHEVRELSAGDDHTVGPDLVPSCTALAAGDGVLAGADYETLRTFRDSDLAASPAGQRYVLKLLEHTDELVDLILRDGQVKQTMASVALGVVQAIRSPSQPVPSGVIGEASKLLGLLDSLGSEALKVTVASARADLEHFRDATIAEGLANMTGMTGPSAAR